ncbi:MAG: hypothetical protein KGJ81_09290, partial [Alphaproteobacteria bacterium]|nr:hypothetical protein [Alphaproteobacteria bacterium]
VIGLVDMFEADDGLAALLALHGHRIDNPPSACRQIANLAAGLNNIVTPYFVRADQLVPYGTRPSMYGTCQYQVKRAR